MQLKTFQQTGIEFLASRHVAFLGDVMGLGKTIQGLFAASSLNLPTLVIAPKNVVPQWGDMLKEWKIKFKSFRVIGYEQFVIQFTKAPDLFNEYKILILDEAHRVKSPDAQRTRTIVKTFRQFDHIWFLSGTPIPRAANDLWTFYNLCYPKRFTYSQFSDYFCKKRTLQLKRGRKTIKVKTYYGGQNLDELKDDLKPFMLRRFKNDVEEQWPTVVYRNIFLAPKPNVKIDLPGDRLDIPGSPKEDPLIAEKYLQAGETKIKKTLALATDILRDHTPIIIFFHHRETLDRFEEMLLEKKILFSSITGGTAEKLIQQRLEEFNKGKIEILLLTMGAGGEGLNLQKSHVAVFAELPWNQTTLDQCVGRVDRLGQKHIINIYLLIRRGSLDTHILRNLDMKKQVISEAVEYGR